MKWAPFVLLAVILGGLVGCKSTRIAVVVRLCVVRGMDWTLDSAGKETTATGTSSVDSHVADLMEQANAIWTTGADIAFLQVPNSANNDHIPIIDDPFPPGVSTSVDPFGGPGKRGDIQQDQDGSVSSETVAAVASCKNAWAAAFPAGQPGVTVVIGRALVRADGHADVSLAAFETPVFPIYVGAKFANRDLCVRPRSITAGDVSDHWVIVQTAINQSGQAAFFGTVLAHELGHALLLQHGDGEDNDGNGKFDDFCDFPEFSTLDANVQHDKLSLMNPAVFADVTRISALQRELAREAAVHMAGTVGGPP